MTLRLESHIRENKTTSNQLSIVRMMVGRSNTISQLQPPSKLDPHRTMAYLKRVQENSRRKPSLINFLLLISHETSLEILGLQEASSLKKEEGVRKFLQTRKL
jgi:hypothetical protein